MRKLSRLPICILAVPCLLLVLSGCKSSDKDKTSQRRFKWFDARTNKQWEVTCDSTCEICIGVRAVSPGSVERDTFYAGDEPNRLCLLPVPEGSGSTGGDTEISPDSVVSLRMVNFRAADSSTNKWAFDDWRYDSTRHGTKISYLTFAAGCSTQFMVNIRYDTTYYDSFRLSIEGDEKYELSLDPIFDRDTMVVHAGNTVVSVYSLDDDHKGSASIHVAGYLDGVLGPCLAGDILECENAEDQLKLEVSDKDVFLPLVHKRQERDNWCWAAVSSMVLQWYYRPSLHNETFLVEQDDIVEWTWGSTSSDDARTQGVPLCNMLGGYNVDCSKLSPEAGATGPDGCSRDCAGCKTCEYSGEDTAYDRTADKCCDMRWYNTGSWYVGYTGTDSLVAPATSFAWGVTCVLKTAHKRWPDIGIPDIPNSCWGLMQPSHVVSQLDLCRPIIIEHDRQGARHNVVIVGYTLDGDEPSEEMDVHYLDPGERSEYETKRWQRLAYSMGWNQSVYLEYSPSFVSMCRLCK